MRNIFGMIQNIETMKSATAKLPKKKLVIVRRRLNRIKAKMTKRFPVKEVVNLN